jgi:hypothetical protein
LPALEDYVYTDWKTERILPWSHLEGPLPQTTLIKHLNDAIANTAAIF